MSFPWRCGQLCRRWGSICIFLSKSGLPGCFERTASGVAVGHSGHFGHSELGLLEIAVGQPEFELPETVEGSDPEVEDSKQHMQPGFEDSTELPDRIAG